MRQKISELLEEVKKIEEKSSLSANESRHSANEASGGLTASYSAAGDAEHARNSANLSIDKAKQIRKLMEELNESVFGQAPNAITPVCFIKVRSGGVEKDFYMVNNPVYISGFNLISPISPIGESLMGKKAEDLFLYKTNDQTFTGKVLEIG